MTLRDPCLIEPRPNGDEPVGDLVDRYLDFVAARCRPNTVAAARSDLGVFFSVIDKLPVAVSASDVLEFIAAQRRPVGDGKVVRLADGESGLSARTIKRRAATVSGFFSWLTIVGAVGAHTAPPPEGARPRRGQCVARRAAPLAGPGHGRSDGARWVAPLRGARPPTAGSAPGRGAGVHRRWQGRSSAAGADLSPVLRQCRPLSGRRTPHRGDDGPGLCRPEGTPPGTAALGGRAR